MSIMSIVVLIFLLSCSKAENVKSETAEEKEVKEVPVRGTLRGAAYCEAKLPLQKVAELCGVPANLKYYGGSEQCQAGQPGGKDIVFLEYQDWNKLSYFDNAQSDSSQGLDRWIQWQKSCGTQCKGHLRIDNPQKNTYQGVEVVEGVTSPKTLKEVSKFVDENSPEQTRREFENLLEQINRQKKYVIAIEDSTMNGIWEVSSYNTSATEFGCPPDKLKEVAVFLHQQSGKD